MSKYFFKYLTLASSLLILAACGPSSDDTAPKKSKSQAEQAVQHLEKKTPPKSEQTTTTSQTTTVNTTTTSSTSKADKASSKSQTASNIDAQSIIAGDYSSLAGTWKNALGETLVFTKDGLVTTDMIISFSSYQDNKLYFSIANPNSLTGGGALVIIPAGTLSPGGIQFGKDVMTAGQSLASEDDPFYKVSDSQTPLPYRPESNSGRGSGDSLSGYLNLYQDTPVYARPDRTTEPVITYPKGESVYWDKYISENGEYWYSYVTYAGERYYIAHADTFSDQ